MAAIGIADVGAKRGNFDLGAVLDDENDAELRADSQAFGKHFLDALGMHVGCDVVVERLAVELKIAHAAADEVGLMACLTELAADFIGEFARAHAAIMRETLDSRHRGAIGCDFRSETYWKGATIREKTLTGNGR